MPQRPYKYLTDFYKGKIKRSNELVEYVHTQTDSFITWIIGFSFSGLLLLVSDLNNFSTRIPTKSILICLFICIVLGIAFRYISYLITMFQKSLDDYWYGLFYEESMYPIANDENLETMKFEDLHLLIKDDFAEDIPYTFPINDDLKKSEEPNLRNWYLSRIAISKKEFDSTIKHLAEIDETAFKIKKEKTIKAIEQGIQNNPKIGYNQALWFNIRGWLYTLCLLSFLTAVFILCIALLLLL